MDSILRIPSVTGVDLTLRIAGAGGRSYAFIIDWHFRLLGAACWLLAGMFTVVGALHTLTMTDESYAAFVYFAVLPSSAIYLLYHPVLEVLMHGQTPGKRIAGVRLVALATGGAPGIGALLIRNAFRVIDSLPALYAIGLATAMVTKHAVRMGDIAAGTVLVYDEPHGRESFAGLSATAVQRLGLERAQVVHDLLARWPELEPGARSRLARQLLAKQNIAASATTDAELAAKLEALLV